MTTPPERQRKTKHPCPVCRLHPERCICAWIPRLELRTRLALVIHTREMKRTTNTGQLAVRALANSQIYIRGEAGAPLDLSSLLTPDYESYVLFPSEDAVELKDIKPQKPVQLIVSDGNWRQASKLNTRQPEIAHLPRVKISAPNTARYHLRKEHFAEGMATLEAIALAFRILEGDAVGDSLAALYDKKLSATLQGRGVIPCASEPE